MLIIATSPVRIFFFMENLSDIKLDINQYRLIMCMRMAKAMGKGEIYLDATTHRMRWRMENDGVTTGIFDSIDKMEEFWSICWKTDQDLQQTGLTTCTLQ